MTAADVVRLLRARHAADVFVAECKDGPTISRGGRHLRLDAWAMPRSWTHPETYGYEVKVSRADWVRDRKLEDYFGLTDYFCVVAPRGVVDPAELPAAVGYLEVATTGTRLLTKRRPTRLPADEARVARLLRYVLMSRATIDGEAPVRTVDQWRAWLAQKEEDQRIGHAVSRRLRAIYQRDVEAVRARLRDLERREAAVASFDARLSQLGVSLVNAGNGRWAAEAVASRVGALSLDDLRRARQHVADLQALLGERA